MLEPRRISTTHWDAFLKRYDSLQAWAVQMTAGDRALAEDLLHDLFLLFTLRQPDLNRIQNLDNYLYTSLRNLHISQLRRTTRRRFEQLSVVEYESARLSLNSLGDGRDLIQAQDELRRVCHYACARKESAIAASVLLLRFFHGYYPSEIARVVRSTRTAVDKRLHAARVEARAYLIDAKSLAFLQQRDPAISNLSSARFATATGDFLLELQQTIYRSRQGECLSREEVKHVYETDRPSPVTRKFLAHVASCPTCLDLVNNVLGLPTLSERYPTDTMDKDNKKGGGPTGGGNKFDAVRKLSEWEREAREIFEHKPQELCVSVNGYLLGAQSIGSELSEFTLNVTVHERINFCEVFSEQGLRLLMMNVEDLPPNGPGELHQRVELSEARWLESSLLFSNPFPTLNIVYHDPALASEAVAVAEDAESEYEPAMAPATVQRDRNLFDQAIRQPKQGIPVRIKSFSAQLFNPRFWLRPGTATALVAVFLVAIGLFVSLRRIPTRPEPSAAELLQHSALAEDALANDRNRVTHRTVNLEEKNATGNVISRRRIELWQSAEKGLTARRLYDEKGSLIAGDWRRADGVQTIYHHAAKPQIQIANPRSTIRGPDIWQLLPSAKDFALLIGTDGTTGIEQRGDVYVVSATFANTSTSFAVKSATLTLRRSDLHPIEQTLFITQDEQYRFVETTFERQPNSDVAPAVFEPDKELLSTSTPLDVTPALKLTTSPATITAPPAPVVASAAMEVEVLRLLNQVGADMGEQITLTRTAEGRLVVQGITETDKRKHELLNALNPLANNPALEIDIHTLDEALARQPEAPMSSGSISIETAQPSSSALPIDKELRLYLTGRNIPQAQIDEAIRQFSTRTIHRSLEILKHAGALKALAERFSPDELKTLDSDAKATWRLLVKQHAQAVEQQTVMLERELGPIFPGMSSAVTAPEVVNNEEELVRSAELLFVLCSANDRAISEAFTISPEVSRGDAIKSSQFWRSLKSTTGLASRISDIAF